MSDDEGNLKDDLPYGTAIEVNNAMVNLIWELGNDDPCNVKWLSPKMRKPEVGIQGMISVHQSLDHGVLTTMSREEEDPFIWP